VTASILVHHPWPIDACESAASAAHGHGILLEFAKFWRNRALRPVPFLTKEEFEAAKQRIHEKRGGGSSAWYAVVKELRCETSVHPMATPDAARVALSSEWRQALHREVTAANWRRPQIIFSAVSATDWDSVTESAVTLDDSAEMTFRDLACMERYHLHPFAESDTDPWDMRYGAVRAEGKTEWPRLPRPPRLGTLRGESLEQEMAQGLPRQPLDRPYYFIPSRNWNFNTAPKGDWRTGRGFPHTASFTGSGTGPIDVEKRVWVWDPHHGGHWDVQAADDADVGHIRALFGRNYFRVTETGIHI
jgi:hypothetical protein